MENKKFKISDIICVFVAILPAIYFAVVYSSLPNQLPMQWGFDGEVNRYGNKSEYIILAVLPILLYVLMKFLPKFDPKQGNYQKFQGFYDSFIIAIVVLMSAFFFLALAEGTNPGSVNIGKIIPIAVGGLFVFIGNFLPKAKQNFFFGIKTPWTLSSENVWMKTHRFGGVAFIIGGLLIAITPFFGGILQVACMIASISLILWTIPQSYIYFKNEKHDLDECND